METIGQAMRCPNCGARGPHLPPRVPMVVPPLAAKPAPEAEIECPLCYGSGKIKGKMTPVVTEAKP